MTWTSDNNLRGVRSAAWITSSDLPSMKMEPFIVSNALSSDECDLLLAHIYEQPINEARLAGGMMQQSVRSASVCWVDEVEYPWLSKRLTTLASNASREFFPFSLSGFDEGFQLTKYDAGALGCADDFYDWHIDMGLSTVSRTRKLSFIAQLSDPAAYEGGELEINFDGNIVQLSASKGTIIAFPSFVLHRVRPVTLGTRCSLAAWLHGPSFR